MRVPVAGGKMPLGSQYYGEGDEVLLTCARGTESDVPLNVQIWLKADVHCSVSPLTRVPSFFKPVPMLLKLYGTSNCA